MKSKRMPHRFLVNICVLSLLLNGVPVAVSPARADDPAPAPASEEPAPAANPILPAGFADPAGPTGTLNPVLPSPGFANQADPNAPAFKPAAAGTSGSDDPSVKDGDGGKPPETAEVPDPQTQIDPTQLEDTSEQSAGVTLCGAGGYGAEMEQWPPIDNPEFNKAANNFINKKNNELLFVGSQVHRKYKKATSGKPDLSKAMDARKTFFVRSFGMISDKTPGALLAVCDVKRQAAQYTAKFNDSNKSFDINACGGAQKNFAEVAGAAKRAYLGISAKANERLKSGFKDENDKQVPGLESDFKNEMKINRDGVSKESKETAEKLQIGDGGKLEQEYIKLWGTAPVGANEPNEDGDYAIFLMQLQREKKNADTQAKRYEKLETEALAREDKCNGKIVAAKGQHDPSQDPPPPDTKTHKKPDDPAPGGGDLGAGKQYTPPPASGGMGDFMKDNWMWLVGGAAVIGGGTYFYIQHEKKEKAAREFWNNDANFIIPNGNHNGGGANGGQSLGSNVPPGTKLIIVSGVSAPTAGQTMNTVDVAMVDAAGVVQAIDGLAIEASCLTPNPCSLTGAKSVTAVGGHASFSGLMFNQADRAVVLQFSGPGMASATSAGSFDVQGSATRQ